MPFDHVAIRVADLGASRRFYDTVFAAIGKERDRDDRLVAWGDWWIAAADAEHPVTRHLHVGFYVPDHALVEAFWRAGLRAGYQDDGPPGPRPRYGADYVGAFLRDPDGNSVEAMHHGAERTAGRIDHMWLRVADVAASAAFYESVAGHTGFDRAEEETGPPALVRFRGPGATFSVLAGEPVTANAHLAFAGPGHATDRVLDPDGHGVEVVEQGRPGS